MNVITYPTPYQSAFREACFEVDGLAAGGGTEIDIRIPSQALVLGTKRIYSAGRASINVAPYVRRLLSPRPLCDRPAGMYVDGGRTVACGISSGGRLSSEAWLTAGVDDAPPYIILSAAGPVARIGFGQVDELSVIAADFVQPVVEFTHEGREYTDDSFDSWADSRMMTFVVDANDMGRRFALLTGEAPERMTGFTVWLTAAAGVFDPALARRYEMNTVCSGRRLAWVNRYGAVDYFDFPVVAGGRVAGGRERIYTPKGYRTVATSSESTETLLSPPCDAEGVKWLSEIFSSPAVWLVEGGEYDRVEVSGGTAEYSAARPGVVSVSFGPVKKTVSRKL